MLAVVRVQGPLVHRPSPSTVVSTDADSDGGDAEGGGGALGGGKGSDGEIIIDASG